MKWLDGLAPDVVATARRFPFAILLAAVTTALSLVAINELTALPFDDLARWIGGFATAAVCAVAGALFIESRPESRTTGLLLIYGLPVAAILTFQIRDVDWFFPVLLPVVALLWLSVSPATRIGRGEDREAQQDRFWWMNSQAIATAIIAGVGFLIICIGILAIERSLALLFGVSSESIFYRWVLPFVGLFLTPVYWLSTLPRSAGYDAPEAGKPEFIGMAIGFLGQFVLVPLLLIYAAILLAYTAQIVVTQSLPQGTIGWMVLGFVVAGAATWLVLHPAFMRNRGIVRLFRRWWFWLTLIPLALFALAVWVRVDAYGLTTERMLLIAGGAWAAVLALVFLIGRGDIRLIPALAGGILLLLSIGPWNLIAMPNFDQGARLSRLLAEGGANSNAATPQWDDRQVADARSAIHYLYQEHGRDVLRDVLARHGVDFDTEASDPYALMAELGHPQTVSPGQSEISSVSRDAAAAVDVSATPFYLRHVDAYYSSGWQPGLGFALEDGVLAVRQDEAVALRIDLKDWAGRQPTDKLAEPWIDFTVDGRNYRLVVSTASWQDDPGNPDDLRQVTNLSGELFADRSGDATPTP